MRTLVSDSSVLIDIEHGSLLEPCFRLPYRFAVPDLLYERELKEHGGEGFKALGLAVEEMEGDEIGQAVTLRAETPDISWPDSFALVLAQTRRWILLTGDSALRELAGHKKTECHGVLWLIDRIHEEATATAGKLYEGLAAISRHHRCRLPKAEVCRRLKAYAGGLPKKRPGPIT